MSAATALIVLPLAARVLRLAVGWCMPFARSGSRSLRVRLAMRPMSLLLGDCLRIIEIRQSDSGQALADMPFDECQ